MAKTRWAENAGKTRRGIGGTKTPTLDLQRALELLPRKLKAKDTKMVEHGRTRILLTKLKPLATSVSDMKHPG